jgi:hypothetical protein
MNQFHLLYGKLREHPDKFFHFYRTSVKSFDELISLVKHVEKKLTKPHLVKQSLQPAESNDAL